MGLFGPMGAPSLRVFFAQGWDSTVASAKVFAFELDFEIDLVFAFEFVFDFAFGWRSGLPLR
ncbi:MAG: hypothetical protein WBV60_03765 [Terriglobales bacterium]